MQFAGTMQLAALGPTSVIFSFSSYVFNALGIATTSKVSALLGEDKAAEASRCAGAALVVALVAGIVSLMIMQVLLTPVYCMHLPLLPGCSKNGQRSPRPTPKARPTALCVPGTNWVLTVICSDRQSSNQPSNTEQTLAQA